MTREDAIKRVDEYITEREVKDFCSNCSDFCSRHCVIWRTAELRYNEHNRNARKMLRKEM